MTRYAEFLRRKSQEGSENGFEPNFIPDGLFDFQRFLTTWAIRNGRCLLSANTGLGKTYMELVWAENVRRHTNRPVLILTPLAVSAQTIREAQKFGIDAYRVKGDSTVTGINVVNYERLHHLDPSNFSGVVCDESSILKSFNGARRNQITEFMKKIPYRMLATATAAPNDYAELGTSSEALGRLGYMDMLNRFFKNDQNNSSNRGMYGNRVAWRFKGHAEIPFWRWVCSWAMAVRMPSDIGFSDDEFILPDLIERQHVIESTIPSDGYLFALPASNLREEREERNRTIGERCDKVAELVNHDHPALVWCHLNSEGDRLVRTIPDAEQVTGSDSDEVKESRFLAFANGDIRVLVTKPKIGAWGLNFQHCNHVVFFPSHSFEQYYQGVRRCWRYGQKREVTVDIVSTEGESRVLANLQRKADQANQMFSNLVAEMNNAVSLNLSQDFDHITEIPSWL